MSNVKFNSYRTITTCFLLCVCGPTFTTEFARAEDEKTSVHLQSTVVSQQHPDFSASYSGNNSFTNASDTETSITWTIFAGWKLWNWGELYVDPELAGGSGFSQTKGIAGFPNGEIYRVDDAPPKWNLARLFYLKSFVLGDETGGRHPA